jgi:uncharacterized protein
MSDTQLVRGSIPKVRAPRFADEEIPNWWFMDNAYSTHSANALHMLFPDGERFFIRSVMHYVDRLDPHLRARVKAFVGQEGRHGHAHDRVRRVLEQQGYEVDTILRVFKAWLEGIIEPSLPPVLRLSATAAIEHVTATLGVLGLSTDALRDAPESMAQLLKWHGAEEIEHRSVAFDVLNEIDPRLRTRALGAAIAAAFMIPAWLLARRSLLAQERARGVDLDEQWRSYKNNPRAIEDDERWVRQVSVRMRDYLRRDFHPDQDDESAAIAQAYLQAMDARM